METPEELSIKEADQLQQFIKNLPSIKSKLNQVNRKGFGQVDWTNSERMLLDFADEIKSKIIGAEPDLAYLKKNYGQVVNDIKFVRGKLAKGNTINNLKNFDNWDDEVKVVAGRLFPKDLLNKIEDFNSADKFAQLLKQFGIYGGYAGAGAIGAMTIKSFLKEK